MASSMFDEDAQMLFGDCDFLAGTVPCIAGELELQVQSYERAAVGDLAADANAAAKSFSLTKDSGGSSLSALAVADFGGADFMDNVSLEDLAAADHYGHTVCGRQSTADSAAGSGRQAPAGAGWHAPTAPAAARLDGRSSSGAAALGRVAPQQSGRAEEHPHLPQYQQQQLQQQHHHHQDHSSDGDMSHTVGDGEASGVGHGKGMGNGAHSEPSEDNMQGVASAAAAHGEEHMSMPSFGLSLSRLRQAPPGAGAQQAAPGEPPAPGQGPRAQPHGAMPAAPAAPPPPHGAAVPPPPHAQHASAMTRAYSVDSMAQHSAMVPDPSPTEGQRRGAAMYRSFSYVAPDTLPMDFHLGCGDGGSLRGGGAGGGGSGLVFGARGRSASLNEMALRRQWLHEGELLAPRLPPSVSELELLELPEDSVPVRPMGHHPHQHYGHHPHGMSPLGQVPPAHSAASAAQQAAAGQPGGRSLGPGTMQFSAGALSPGAGGAQVKRKIITSPSPLLQQQQQPAKPASKARSAGLPAPGGVPDGAGPGLVGPTPKGQSPKRAKVAPGGPAPWQDGGLPAPGAGLIACGWQAPGAAQRAVGAAGAMKTVRSMPANMNSFLEGIEVTVRPLGTGGADSLVSPNSSAASAGTPHHPGLPPPRGTTPFALVDPSAAAAASAAVAVASAPPAGGARGGGAGAGPSSGKASKGKAAGLPPPAPGQVAVPGMGMGMGLPMPHAGMVPGGGGLVADAKRPGMMPSVPKPRKRASPNGNPPKAPAPNPNGHSCTQCGTQTTPVWRAGPHGPKTLCNACGVRYMKVAKGNTAPVPRKQQQQQ